MNMLLLATIPWSSHSFTHVANELQTKLTSYNTLAFKTQFLLPQPAKREEIGYIHTG